MTAEVEVELKNELSEIRRLNEIVEAFAERHDFPAKFVYSLNLCLDELITNIVGYAYEDDAEHAITVRLVLVEGMLRAVVEDDGKPFNPLDEVHAPDLDASLEDRQVGGLGVHFIKTLMDSVDYRRDGGRNRLTMSKRIGEAAA